MDLMDLKDIKEEYSKTIDDYKDFLNEVCRTVKKILTQNDIPTAYDIYGRAKQLDSISEKHISKRYVIKKSITELNDLVGIRIVILYPELKNKVIRILKNKFQLLNKVNENVQNPDKFGYSSVHLTLKIKNAWANTPDWENHSNKKIEVQIRTLSEHIWAEISHSLFYKREENIPKIMNRDLSKLSALLEVVDDKIQDIKAKVEKHFEYIIKAPFQEILGLDLNSETFRRIMVENSKGLYKLNDYQNKILSSKIEKEYNILNTNLLNDLIFEKIDLNGLNENEYIEKVIELLEKEKLTQIEQQENKIE